MKIMLKWLQSGVYHTSNDVNDIITDDPLATLNFKNDEVDEGQTAKQLAAAILPFKIGDLTNQQKEIYSVSR